MTDELFVKIQFINIQAKEYRRRGMMDQYFSLLESITIEVEKEKAKLVNVKKPVELFREAR